MANLLIRDVPDVVRGRLRKEQGRRMMSQNAYLVSLLEEAVDRAAGPSLFKSQQDGTAEHPAAGGSTALPFTFIDLFSGVGGLRLGLEAVGGRCVFSCERDKYALKTYLAWYGENAEGDVAELAASDRVPRHE